MGKAGGRTHVCGVAHDSCAEEEKVENDPDRFLLIEALASARDDFCVMEGFVTGLPEGEAKRDLERVLRRAKPFRNFPEALHDWPDVQKQWYAVRDCRAKADARDWLADNGIEPIPRPPTV
jgi:hypothetical protein